VERTQPAEASGLRALEGLGVAVDALARSLERGCDLRLRTVAREIRWRPGSAEIVTASGPMLRASAVVVTVPLPLLDPPADVPGALRFSPRLDAKLGVLRTLHMGPVVKVVLGFRRAFWLDIADLNDVAFLHAYEHPVPTWWTAVDPAAPLLTGWAGGPGAARLAGASGARLAELATGSLAAALAVSPSDVAGQLEGWHFHDWNADPFCGGGYTYVGVGGTDAHRALAEPVARTLFFAGEATGGDGYNATLEGALRSGRRAADELLEG
jgi:monoamine oxidase